MVNVKELTKGSKVHYIPQHYVENGKYENGIVKSITPNGEVFVVYNCNGEWHNFENYIAANTNPEDLFPDWKYGIETQQEDDEIENDFQCCDDCDIPDACADFGCAIEQGLHKPNIF